MDFSAKIQRINQILAMPLAERCEAAGAILAPNAQKIGADDAAMLCWHGHGGIFHPDADALGIWNPAPLAEALCDALGIPAESRGEIALPSAPGSEEIARARHRIESEFAAAAAKNEGLPALLLD